VIVLRSNDSGLGGVERRIKPGAGLELVERSGEALFPNGGEGLPVGSVRSTEGTEVGGGPGGIGWHQVYRWQFKTAQQPRQEERGKLGVRQEPAGGFNRTGGVSGACCRISHWRSTGSPSKAMDWAT
jgi:hypothetical protein